MDPDDRHRGKSRSAEIWGTCALLFAVAIWGVNFVVVKDALSRWPVFPFLALRFWIATVSFLPLVWWEHRRLRGTAATSADTIPLAFGAGLALFLAYTTQTFGIQLTTASLAAFLTALFVVFVPLILIVRKGTRPRRLEWASAILAIIGVMILNNSPTTVLNLGSLLLIGCAFFYAVQITLVGTFGGRTWPVRFTAIQMSTIAIASSVAVLPYVVAGTLPSLNRAVLWAALFTGVLASSVAYLIQTLAQRHISPMQAAIILTFEPVFATFAAVLVLHEIITINIALGGFVILTAILLCNMHPVKQREPATSTPTVER